jgi:signal transduction histidine kinase/ActR/RegA family two-component response regulator
LNVALSQKPWRDRDFNLPFWVGILVYTTLIIGRRTFLPANSITAIWPAGGVLAAALMLSPPRAWKWLLLTTAVENTVVNGAFGFSTRTLISIPEACLLAFLIRNGCPRSLNFADPRTLTLFILKAVVPASVASALACYVLPNINAPPTSFIAAIHWFVGHSLGAGIAVPIMVTLLRQRRYRVFDRPAWELAVCGVGMVVYAWMLFGGHRPALSLMMFPMAMFVAFRYGPVGAATVSALLMGLALLHIYAGIPGPRPADYDQIQWVQVLVAVMFLTSLPAAGALASLRRTRRLLARRTEIARQARRRADAAAEAKTRFLTNMSHEIRTPLNGVIGLADALSRAEMPQAQREMVDMIRGSGGALNGILSDVLDLARADAGGLNLTPERFDAREAVSSASYLFETIARKKGVNFIVEFDIAERGQVVGDALRIRQIVSNLISNAVKFTSAGEVRVEASLLRCREDAELADLTVTVADTGPGFSDEVKARLFRRFEQADNSIARSYGGAGLGLAISRELAAMMNGRIDCRSEPGGGATFVLSLTLPLAADAEPAAAAAPDEAVAASGGRRLKLLLAEDHIVNQRVVQAILADTVDLTIVDNGQAAVDACQSCVFDLILMDTQMPVMDGLSAIRAIRAAEQRRGGPSTPIISLTADAMPHQVEAALAAGADRHLAKPITVAGLMGAMSAELPSKAA